ncbi:putative Ig domain-containing protein [Geothrix sp. 21YS21S-2]|uniref:putative Ig domain-containing protein n=1 Tax=Geothrix sp. 21YS21S-2 TaxID=3068893 RepID=UPI0027BA7C0B|nr:putative Ig domain-containing protein [Geothrix sp. 21YS21S-2]
MYAKGVAIASNSPSSGGGAVVSYSVSPALPAGLVLSTGTGVISGTPTAVSALASYTVTAANTGGSTTKDLTITVNDAAPSGLAYTLGAAVYAKGSAIAPNSPTSGGGAVVSYSVSPALPAGLSLNTATGQITGTPAAVAALATYTVTATNTGGSTTKDLTITVNDAAPSGLAYTLSAAVYAKGSAIPPNSPTSGGGAVVSYSVSPALPAGLILNTGTGQITGTPTAVAALATYTVTATNTGGSTTQDLTITVHEATVIIAGNAGAAGVLMTCSGGTATADGSGNYTFSVAYGWSGTVTPALAGYTFSAPRTYTDIVADQAGQDYTATAITFTISGALGASGAGASLAYTDGSAKTATADASGHYAFTVSYDWSGTVTPSLAGFVFTVDSRTYAHVLADQTAQDYTLTAVRVPPSYAGCFMGLGSGDSGGGSMPGYWVDGTWFDLPLLEPGQDAWVTALAVSGRDRDVLAVGFCTRDAGGSVPGYWKNGTWVGLPVLNGGGDAQATAILVSGGDVYVAGLINGTSGVVVPGYWKNEAWIGLTPLASDRNSLVVALATSGSEVLAAGYSSDVNNVGVPGYWRNGVWRPLSQLDITRESSATAVVVDGDDVYAGGFSTDSSGVQIPGYWKNGIWTGLDRPDSNTDWMVISLAVSGSDVYAMGFSLANTMGASIAGYWKNGAWVVLPPLSVDGSSVSTVLVASGKDVFVTGASTTADVTVTGYWKNGTWFSLPSPDPASPGIPLSFVAPSYIISGNAGVARAVLTYTDGTTRTAVADGDGNYCFSVSPDWSGTVTPSKPGSVFTPASKVYTHVQADQTAKNFSAVTNPG